MTRILALDTGGQCGWAFGIAPDSRPIFDTVKFEATDRAARLCHFHAWLCDAVDDHKPDLVAYEKPVHRGAGSLVLFGYAAVAEMVAYARESAVVPVHNATLKKFGGVKGSQKLMAAAWARGAKVLDDHQGDAVMLFHYVASGLEEVV